MFYLSVEVGLTCVNAEVWSHWNEHRTVICPTQLGNTVQEDGGHPLVLVLYKTKYFEGKPAHLTFPILKDCGLGVFFTADSEKKRKQENSDYKEQNH